MEEGKTSKNHLTSAAAFVEGGVQEACDDACSICLEAFCENEPSTVTGCKHEFHLQCILEWCQRSSQCPMCWQPINLKDPSSQELLDAIEQERSIRATPRNSTIFHHPALGNFELQHLRVGATDAELEERIIQQLAAAAGMGRARQIARREGRRNRSSAQGHPHFLVFSTTSNEPSSPASFSPTQRGEGETASGNQPGVSSTDRSPSQTSLNSQDRAGTSELQSFSESLKSRINAMSMRYKESITKSTKGWKEKLFSRNTSPADSGSEVRGEVNVGVPTVSRTMEHHETVESNPTPNVSVSNTSEDRSLPDQGNQQHRTETHHNSSLSESNVQASFAATSAPN